MFGNGNTDDAGENDEIEGYPDYFWVWLIGDGELPEYIFVATFPHLGNGQMPYSRNIIVTSSVGQELLVFLVEMRFARLSVHFFLLLYEVIDIVDFLVYRRGIRADNGNTIIIMPTGVIRSPGK